MLTHADSNLPLDRSQSSSTKTLSSSSSIAHLLASWSWSSGSWHNELKSSNQCIGANVTQWLHSCDAMMHYFNWKKKLARRHSFLHRHHTWHSTHSSPIQRWAHRCCCCCLRWWVITIELIDNRGWSRFSIFNSFSQTASHSTSVISQNTAWLLFAVFLLSFYQHSFSKWPAKEVCKVAAALKKKDRQLWPEAQGQLYQRKEEK